MKRTIGIALCCASMAAAAMAAPVTFTTLAGTNGGRGRTDGQGSAARFDLPRGIARDAAGNLYLADFANHAIRKVSAGGDVTTVAGLAGTFGIAEDGQGSAARFYLPEGIAVDASGNQYVADTANATIRKVTPAGYVTTLAGVGGDRAIVEGQGSAARFLFPAGIAADAAGNLYVTDENTIRKVTPAGYVTTLAGLAYSWGSADGQGNAARFQGPAGIAVDAGGNLYVADSSNHTIRRVTPAGDVTTVAGEAGSEGSADGHGIAARFYRPLAVALDAAGNLYVAEHGNSTIRRMTPDGDVTTVAGLAGSTGSIDGQGSAARFYWPGGIAADAVGNLYVADSSNHTIRAVTPAGEVTTLAGLAVPSGSADGQGAAASFRYARGIALDGADNLYVTDAETIRKVTPSGDVTTVAGLAESPGSDDGHGSAARFASLAGIAANTAGNFYVVDNNTVRRVTPEGDVMTLAGLAGMPGSDDGPGSAARFFDPQGIAADALGNLYVADSSNHAIRKVTAAGDVTTLAGSHWTPGAADGQGAGAQFGCPADIAAGGDGYLYVTDTCNSTIRKVSSAGDVTTIAGRAGVRGSANGHRQVARFNAPFGIGADGKGTLYVTDTSDSTIRRVPRRGRVTTIGGLARAYGTSEGTGAAARFTNPEGVAVDSHGTIYVAERNRVIAGRPGLADTATIDCSHCETGVPRALDVQPRTATRWEWTMIRRPSASAAVLSMTTAPNPTFTPDVADLYEFRVVATDGSRSSITTVSLLAVSPSGTHTASPRASAQR